MQSGWGDKRRGKNRRRKPWKKNGISGYGVSVEEIAGKLHVTLGEVNSIIAEIDMSPEISK